MLGLVDMKLDSVSDLLGYCCFPLLDELILTAVHVGGKSTVYRNVKIGKFIIGSGCAFLG